jgi:hypothetical protein
VLTDLLDWHWIFLVLRFGLTRLLVGGLLLAAAGLAVLARAPVDGPFIVDVLPSMILLGLGPGIAFNPVLLAAMSEVRPEEAGVASGIVNTSFQMGGALRLAVLASVSASQTQGMLADGDPPLAALAGGYHVAFAIGALFADASVGGWRKAMGCRRLSTGGGFVPARIPSAWSSPLPMIGTLKPKRERSVR